MLAGFAAAGNAGNASVGPLFLLTLVDARDWEGIGGARALDGVDDDAHGVWPGLAPIRLDDDEDGVGSAGKVPLDEVVDQLACRLAEERDDWAVELFSFSTLEPPWAAGPPFNACPSAEPGREG